MFTRTGLHAHTRTYTRTPTHVNTLMGGYRRYTCYTFEIIRFFA